MRFPKNGSTPRLSRLNPADLILALVPRLKLRCASCGSCTTANEWRLERLLRRRHQWIFLFFGIVAPGLAEKNMVYQSWSPVLVIFWLLKIRVSAVVDETPINFGGNLGVKRFWSCLMFFLQHGQFMGWILVGFRIQFWKRCSFLTTSKKHWKVGVFVYQCQCHESPLFLVGAFFSTAEVTYSGWLFRNIFYFPIYWE